MLLRELFEAQARKVVAVMPGGFHPFHPGHKSLYDWAVKTFGQSNVYVAATNDTASRPFPFEVKKKLAAMAGVPESNFMQVKSPFNAMSYKDIVDDGTALVFVRSQKDKNEQPLPDQTKKNGEPGYLRTYTGKDLNTSDEMGYMAYGPTINFDFSGMQIKSASELRATWPEMSDEDKLKAAKLMYGNGAETAVQLLNTALGGSVDEDLEEAQMGDVYMRFKVVPPLDKNKAKPTLMAYAGFANTPAELTLDGSKMQFRMLPKKSDIVNAIKKVIGDKIFIGAEKVVIYNDGAVNLKKFPQYGEFLAWVDQFGKEKVKIVDKPESDNDVEKGPGKKRVKAKWANKKNYTDDNIEVTKYFTIDNNRLMKFLQKSAPKIMQAYRPATKQFVMEPAQYKTFRNWMRSPEVVSKFGDTNVKVDKSKSFSQSVGKEFEQTEAPVGEDVSPENEKKFHNELDDLVHKYFGDSPDEVKMKKKMRKVKEDDLNEAAPLVAAAIWIIKWAVRYGAWPVIKWLLKKHGGKIIGGAAAAYYIDQGWDWVEDKIGAEYAQMLIDNKFEIGMAVALIIGAVALKKYMEKQGDKLVKANEAMIEKAPPGREKQVKALKKKFDDPGAPYAIAWAQHNKKKK